MEHLRKLANYFKDKGVAVPRMSEDMFQHMEDTFLPHILRVLKKDNTLLAEVDLFPGIKVPWTGSDDEWQMLSMTLLHSVLHGDPKEKFGKILETLKSVVPGVGGSQGDEISKILEDEETQSSLQEMLELVMNTRLASLVGEIAQSVQYDDLEIDFEDPEKILAMLRNPQESTVLTVLADRAQEILKDRIRTGKINQQELVREIEMLRAKFQSAFGKYLNEMVVGDAGGGTTGNTAAQILSHHPEARRARMLARLQKKQKEKARK
jgi:vacuolar-type H+-ATPase subunit E/Vma4